MPDLSPAGTELLANIEARTLTVGVIGLGYVGLPLAVTMAEAGYQVIGLDVDAPKVESVTNSESYIADVPSAMIAKLRAAGKLRATTDFSALRDCDAISVCVPTPLRKTRDPDVSYVIAAAESIGKYLKQGTVVVLESTTYPGTTREVILPRLEDPDRRLVVGETFFLAFSPERVDPGREDWTTKTTPKVIGGITPQCARIAAAYYGQAIKTVIQVSSPEAAEMVKLLENTFRAINIGLANETLLMCNQLGIDAWEVIDAAATKPFGFMKFSPGPGLGGHCIPIDPLYLSWRLRAHNYTARFIELASEINGQMPDYWVEQVQAKLNQAEKSVKGSSVLILGMAYKKDVDDIRESPALDIAHLLLDQGAVVSYHDPHVEVVNHDGISMESVEDLVDGLESADCVVIATDHSGYDWDLVRRHASVVVDTRHALGGV